MLSPVLISVGYASKNSLGVHCVDVSSHTLFVSRFSASCEMIFGVAIGILLSVVSLLLTSSTSILEFRRGECPLGCIGRSIGSIAIGTLFLDMCWWVLGAIATVVSAVGLEWKWWPLGCCPRAVPLPHLLVDCLFLVLLSAASLMPLQFLILFFLAVSELPPSIHFVPLLHVVLEWM